MTTNIGTHQATRLKATAAGARRARYKGEVRAQVLLAARKIFVHEGYGSFSLRRLAARLGYSPAAIYKHFTCKAEIFDCLAVESFEALTAAAAAVKTIPGQDPVDRLKRGLHAYVDFGLRNPDHYRFAFLLAQPHAAKPRPRAAYGGLRDRVQACIDHGRFPPADAELIAQSLWAAAHGVTSLLVQKPAFPWVAKRKLIALVIDSAVAGLMHDRR